MKNKVLLMVISFILVLSFCACGSSTTTDNTGITPQETDAVITTESDSQETEAPAKTEYSMGETWTVDGQWSLVINSVSETEERNEYAETNPAAVYVVDYTYTNIGYVDESGLMDGLFFGMDDSIVDNSNVMGYSYPGEVTKYAQEAPVGATCNAQSCIGVDNAGSFKINVEKYDGNGNKQTATFIVSVPEN